MAGDKFERIEKKFWMNQDQLQSMLPVLHTYMKEDQFAYSKIRNIYCDSDDYYLIRRSIEKPKFKEKLRIRSYEGFDKNPEVFVEIKRKVSGVGYKRRIRIPFSEAKDLLEGKEVHSKNPQIDRELQEFVKRYHPKMKIYLTYERIALVGKDDPSLRITLDRNIRYRVYDENIDFSQEALPLLEDESWCLMEVKAPNRMPDWLIASMSYHHIYQAPFSKVGTCFTKCVAPQLNFGVHEVQTEEELVPARFMPMNRMLCHAHS